MNLGISLQRVLAPLAVVMVAVLAAVIPGLTSVDHASAHSGGSKDYISVIKSIEPADLPIQVSVKERDDRVRIENLGAETLVVKGYDKGEDPYVRIDKRGAFVNRNSSAYYQNKGRYGSAVPADIKPGMDPKWQLAQRVPFYSFHDHRIHWMARTVPPSVDPNKVGRQKVFNWKIDVKYGDEPGVIKGTLYYTGGESSGSRLLSWAIAAAAVAGVAVIFLLDRRRRRRRASDDGPV